MSQYELDVTNASGRSSLMTSPLLTVINATTNSSGVFTVDLTNSGYTTILSATADVSGASSAMTDVIGTSIYSISATTITGVAYKAQGAVLGLLGITPVSSGFTVRVSVIGI